MIHVEPQSLLILINLMMGILLEIFTYELEKNFVERGFKKFKRKVK